MEKNAPVIFCRKVLVRLVMGTPFMRKERREVSSDGWSAVLCCPQVLLFSNIQIFKVGLH